MVNEEFQYSKKLEDCPLTNTLRVIGGKWKIEILYLIYANSGIHYGQLKRSLKNITHKVLSNQLKELKEDGMISREEYPVNPPRVVYQLTPRGRSVLPVLKSMYDWGMDSRRNL